MQPRGSVFRILAILLQNCLSTLWEKNIWQSEYPYYSYKKSTYQTVAVLGLPYVLFPQTSSFCQIAHIGVRQKKLSKFVQKNSLRDGIGTVIHAKLNVRKN